MTTPESENSNKEIATSDEFLSSNAQFFAQTLSPVSEILQNAGPMTIVSEEAQNTVVVGLRKVDGDDGDMDVNCVLLKPHQRSIRDCINIVFSEDKAPI